MEYDDDADLSETKWTRENQGPVMDFLTASNLGNREIVRYYLNKGHDINERSKGGWTALMYACASHRDDLVWFFLNSGADVGVVDPRGRHFLTVAAENGNVKAVRLLRNWINVIQEDATEPDRCQTIKQLANLPEYDSGFTPLMLAAQRSNDEMVELLLAIGADTTLRDRSGKTARQLAVLNGHRKTAWILKFHSNFAVRDVLEEAGLLKYHDLFIGVTVTDLLTIGDERLKTLGLTLLGPRKKLLLTIEKIRASKMKRLEVLSLERDKDRVWNETLGPPNHYKTKKCIYGNAAVHCGLNLLGLST